VQQGPRSEGQSKVREPGFWLTAVAGKCSTPLVNYMIKTFIGDPPFEPFSPGVSRSALRRHRDRLEAAMAEHVRDVVAPALRAAAREEFQGACEVTTDDDDYERVWIHYESALPPTDGGIARNIQIEFGG